jgi:hypothetical protein
MVRKKSAADLKPWVERAGFELIALFANGVVGNLVAIKSP